MKGLFAACTVAFWAMLMVVLVVSIWGIVRG